MNSNIPSDTKTRSLWLLFGKTPIFVVFLTVGIRLIGVSNPLLDYASYRQTYTAMIAENFVRYGLDLIRPRIDIIGIRNISEFPIYPLLVALMYKIVGVHEILGRLVSIFFAGASAFVLFHFSQRLFGRRIAFFSTLFFALLPMLVYYTRTFMLESLMLFLSLLALDFFSKWSLFGKGRDLLWGFATLSLVFLTKIPTLYLLFPVLGLIGLHFVRFGNDLSKFWSIYGAIPGLLVLSLLPAFWWYYYVPGHIVPMEGLVADSSSLANTMFSTKGWALRLYFWMQPSTWRNLFLTRPLEYHLTPAGSLLLFLAAFFYVRRHGLAFRSFFKAPFRFSRDWFRKEWQGASKSANGFSKQVSLFILMLWIFGILLFIAAFPVFNSLHEYYQIPLLLPGSILLGVALDYLLSEPFFASRLARLGLLFFVFGGILAYGGYKLYHRLQVNTDYLRLAEVIKAHTKPDEKILILHSLPKPEIFYYAKRRGYILGVFAHADKLPSASVEEYEALALKILKQRAREGVRVFLIPKNVWPPLASGFLKKVQGHCPKLWSDDSATGIRGLYSTKCSF